MDELIDLPNCRFVSIRKEGFVLLFDVDGNCDKSGEVGGIGDDLERVRRNSVGNTLGRDEAALSRDGFPLVGDDGAGPNSRSIS